MTVSVLQASPEMTLLLQPEERTDARPDRHGLGRSVEFGLGHRGLLEGAGGRLVGVARRPVAQRLAAQQRDGRAGVEAAFEHGGNPRRKAVTTKRT